MSAYSLSKLANKFERKYRLLSLGQQVGPDPESKIKYALNALYRLVSYLENPTYKKQLVGANAVAAQNVVSLYRQILAPKMNEVYDEATQRYSLDGETILNMKKFFDSAIQDISTATVALETILPDQASRLEALLNSLRENIRQLQPSQVEVFNP
jgi:hypothetical protein